jgi:hypothetical protein
MTQIRLTFVENWQSRQKVKTEHTVFPTPLYDITPVRISTLWGKGTPGSINAKTLPTKRPTRLIKSQQPTITIRVNHSQKPLNFIDKNSQ